MTLVSADWVVTSADATPMRDAAVRVVDGRVDAVGTAAGLRAEFPEDDEVRGGASILIPGFVDAHMHLYGTLAHGIPLESAPSDFWSFLDSFWWPLVEDRLDHEMIVAATDWVAAELLANGVTSFYDVLEAPHALPGALLAQKEAVEKRGIRAILSFEATERVSEENGGAGLAENRAFIEACRDAELVSGMMCYHTTFTCSEGMIRRAFEMAADLGVLCHAHVNEGTHEPDWCVRHKGMRTFEYYDALGVAGDRMLASQCVQLSERERQIVAERGVRTAHMPLSNGEVGGGIAPVPENLADGVRIGLGSDGYLYDPFEVMRGAFLVHKARLQDPQVMPAHTVFDLATSGAAAVLGLDRVGRLEPGWWADLALVAADLPTPLAEHNVLDQLVMWRSGRDVTDVMVAGEWRVRSGEVLGFDRERARATVTEQAERLWSAI